MVNVKFNTRTQEIIEEIRGHLKTVKRFFPKKYKTEISEQLEICRQGPERIIHRMYNGHVEHGTNTSLLCTKILYEQDSFWTHQGPLWLRKRMTIHNGAEPGSPPPDTYPKTTDQWGVLWKDSETSKGRKMRLRVSRAKAKKRAEEKAKKDKDKPHPQYTPEARAKRKKRALKKQKERKVIEK